MTVLRVVAAAGGPTRDASLGSTKMLRRTPNGLQQIRVPLTGATERPATRQNARHSARG
jgi:hypothetical protein